MHSPYFHKQQRKFVTHAKYTDNLETLYREVISQGLVPPAVFCKQPGLFTQLLTLVQ